MEHRRTLVSLGVVAIMAALFAFGQRGNAAPLAPQELPSVCLAHDAVTEKLCLDLCASREVDAIGYAIQPGVSCLVVCPVALQLDPRFNRRT